MLDLESVKDLNQGPMWSTLASHLLQGAFNEVICNKIVNKCSWMSINKEAHKEVSSPLSLDYHSTFSSLW